MKLSIKLPSLFFAFGILMLAAVAIVSTKGRDILQETTLKNIEREATLLIRLIERNLFERYHDAQAFPMSLGVIDKERLDYVATSALTAANLNNFVQNYKVYRRIIILDKEGNILASNTENAYGKTLSTLPINASKIRSSDWFKQAMSGVTLDPEKPKSSYVIGPRRFLIDDNPSSYDMIFASLILDKYGEPAGLWVNIVDFSAVESIVAETYNLLSNRGFVSSELTVLDDEGRIIVDYDPVGQNEAIYTRDFEVLSRLNLAQNGVEGARLAVAGLSGSNISTHFRKQVEQVTGFAHTSGAYDYRGLGWSVLIRVQVEEAFAQSQDLFRNSFLLATFLLTMIIVVAFALGKQITRPLNDLSKAINHLALGKKDVELPKITGRDEIANMVSELTQLRDIVIDREKLSKETDEQRFQLEIQSRAIDATATGITVADVRLPDAPIIFTNQAFEELTGYPKAEVIGRNCRFLQNHDVEQPEIEKLRYAIKNKLSCSVVMRNYKKDGTLFYNNLRIDPVFSDDGELTHYIGVQTDITELKRAEDEAKIKLENEVARRTQEARDSESRLRTVFDTALDGTVVIDNKGIIVDVNRSLELIFGRIREELIGENVSILMPSHYAEIHDGFINKYLLTGDKKLIGTPRKVEGQHKTGRIFPIEVSVGETWLGDSQVFVGVVKDITLQEETKLREQELQAELRERELIYRAAFNQAAVGICRVSLSGQFIEVNDKMCEIFGYEEHELLQLTFLDVTHADYREKSQRMVKQVLETEQRSFTTDKLYINKLGEEFWATISVSLVTDDSDVPKYFVSVVEDISNRKRIEKELITAKAARDELLRGMRLASDAGGVFNWSLSLDTQILRWDDGTYLLHGVAPGTQLTLSDWELFVHPRDRASVMNNLHKAIEEEQVFNAEYRVINQSTNSVHWVKSSGDIVLDSESQKRFVFGINIDISNERATLAALEKETLSAKQANEAKSRFLATMSHEIRTPMNGVVGMVDLLKETSLDHEQSRMVSTIRDSSFSLLEIINDILDFSKIESGQMELDLTQVNPLYLIEKTLEALWLSANQKGVELYLVYDCNSPEQVLIDPVRTRQILLNLLGNAVKFSQADGQRGLVKLVVQYDTESQVFSVMVKDNGVGMTEEQQLKLFKPFTQADSSTTRKYGGTGLGLSITKSFVELMGGKIAVQSELGIGSEFLFTLPAQACTEQRLFERFDFSTITLVLSISDATLEEVCRVVLGDLNFFAITSEPYAGKQRDQSKTVLITDVGVSDVKSVRTLILNENPSGSSGYNAPDRYFVGTRPLKVSELVLGLAILTAQESPDFDWNDNLIDDEANQSLISDEANQSIRILCAEDQPTNQMVLTQQLTKLGYRFDMAENGRDALSMWTENSYDLVLTDCHMPEMDGFELTSEIRRIESEQNMERSLIIAITANALVGEAEHCLEAGMDDYISKPVELATLRKVLAFRLRGKAVRVREIDDTKPSHDASAGTFEIENLIDRKHLREVIGSDDEEMSRAVLSMFWQSVSQDVEKLGLALKDNDYTQIKSLAHGAKGASSSSGALSLSDLFRTIENNNQDFELVDKALKDVAQMMRKIQRELEQAKII
ncbi:PAS domain S-box protein [Vibrio sp. JPW-9-11-11]|uniref:PAS domain S-box protein n=1 Tax=Vibrio sp. JPW-9-11-11 TaxID=1416532 RepID=UPI0015944C34|nr:PAS domain S-box protein [Vibrio sp. JPW-9-11-11]NVD09016.1 PAS domain S-box protein [Vibrio sp. JPW-9-11-11]